MTPHAPPAAQALRGNSKASRKVICPEMGSLLADIIEFVAMLLFLRAMARGIGALFSSPRMQTRTTRGVPGPNPSATPHRGEMARDPVCGMFVSTELPHTLRRGKETLHFCSRQCLEKYGKDPTNVTS